jgi:hypothetical protein
MFYCSVVCVRVCVHLCVCVCVCRNVLVAALVSSALMVFDSCCSPKKSEMKKSSLSKSPNPFTSFRREAGEEQKDDDRSQKSPTQW